MKRMTRLLLAGSMACGVLACVGIRPAAAQGTRDIYGYISDNESGEVNDITHVIITDVSTRSRYYHHAWSASFGWDNSQRIQYWQHNLPVGDSFYVDVYDGPVSYRNELCWCGFYLPSGWFNFEVSPNMSF